MLLILQLWSYRKNQEFNFTFLRAIARPGISPIRDPKVGKDDPLKEQGTGSHMRYKGKNSTLAPNPPLGSRWTLAKHGSRFRSSPWMTEE